MFMLTHGNPLFRQAIRRSRIFFVLCFSSGAYPDTAATVFFENSLWEYEFRSSGSRPGHGYTLCVVHQDGEVVSVVCPAALVANAVLGLCGPVDVNILQVPEMHPGDLIW